MLALSLLAVMAAGCGESEVERAAKAEAVQAKAEVEEARAEAARIREIQEPLFEQVKAQMFDAESARFQGVHLNEDESVICGEVNGKNRYGGYVGFRGFIANSNGEVFFDDPDDFLIAKAFSIRALENKCVPGYLESSGRFESLG